MEKDLLSIHQAAKLLGVSIDTLRRWDKSGKLLAIRKSINGYRYYRKADIELSLSDLYRLAEEWCSAKNGVEPAAEFYCQNSAVFQIRHLALDRQLARMQELKNIYAMVVAVVGEIGNNSFDHNIGNWRDVPGVFFGYNLSGRQVVLADRGLGILKTLSGVRPGLNSHVEALRVSFTEVVSGRAPEARGNGLKFVKNAVMECKMKLFFQTGDAGLYFNPEDTDFVIKKQNKNIDGCLCVINF